MVDIGHWTYPKPIDTADWEGFVYRIIDQRTQREYIGKKSFHSRRTKKVPGRKNRKHSVKESNWKRYTSSSAVVNQLIKEDGLERFLFLIESLHKTKAALTYAEVERLVVEDALRATLPDGTRKYYNAVIPPIKFLPPHETDDEESARIFSLIKDIYPNESYLWENGMTEEEKQLYRKKYRIGNNNSTKRSKSSQEYEEYLDKHLRGENNPMYGRRGPQSPRYGCSHTEETRKIISEQMKGRFAGEKNPRYGKSPHEYLTEDQLQELKDNLSRKMSGENNPMYGKPCYYKMTEEEKQRWKDNISRGGRGLVGKHSEEGRKRIAEANSGPQKRVICPHCQKEGGISNMKRYHFDFCKSKTN